jgi:hypothetical protein
MLFGECLSIYLLIFRNALSSLRNTWSIDRMIVHTKLIVSDVEEVVKAIPVTGCEGP